MPPAPRRLRASRLDARAGSSATRSSVWLRVPHADPADHVWVRTTPDAEPRFTAAVVDRATAARDVVARRHRRAQPGHQLPLPARRRASGYRFVNGTGVHERTRRPTPPDFRLSAYAPPPAWFADTAFYQVFPDRFASTGAEHATAGRGRRRAAWDDPVETDGRRAVAPAATAATWPASRPASTTSPRSASGGLYLTPFFPAPSSHRYDADTFDHVDPLLGGDDALVSLVKACHNRGIRVIGDLTINHVGRGHEWFRAAQADAASVEAGFFFFRHHPDDYEAWFDVPSLPKLDLRDDELRRRLLDGPGLGDGALAAAAVRPRRLARRRRQHGRPAPRHRRQPRRRAGDAGDDGRRQARHLPRRRALPTTPAATSTATAGTAS